MPFKLLIKGLQGDSGLEERALELTKFGERPHNFVDLDCTTMSGTCIVVRITSDGCVQVWKRQLEALGFRLEVL